ncbi:MAG: M24 family metallopeptidase [Thermomicrobiales bacterium]
MSQGPTSADVYTSRIERVQREMQLRGSDLLFVGPSSDLRYLTGFDAHLSERLNLLVVPATGRPMLIVPVLEAPLAQIAAPLADVYAWSETESPTDLVGKLASKYSPGTVAVSDQLWSGFLLKLQSAMPGVSWVSALEVIKPLRVMKDEREIELLAEVSRLTDEAWDEFIEGGPLSGLTETQAMERLATLMQKRGLGAAFGICASGPNSASPHHHTGNRVIQQGDAVIFDWGSTLEGYHSDVTRTVFIGQPTEKFRQVYDIVLRANQATLDAVKPGVACEDLDRTARDLITAEGYGENFIHRVGHGLGMDVHEEPYLVKGNTTPLEVGMVFSDEPGIYIEGEFGVRIEDSVVVTPHGGKRLNEATRELTIMD